MGQYIRLFGSKGSEEAGDLESPEWPTDQYPASYGRAKKRINRLEYRPRMRELPIDAGRQ